MTWRAAQAKSSPEEELLASSRRSSIQQQLAANLIALAVNFRSSPLVLRLSLPLAATALAKAEEPEVEGDLTVPLVLGVAIVLILGYVLCGPGSAPTGAPVMTHRPESLAANLESAKDD